MKKSFYILAAGIAVSLLLAGCMKSQAGRNHTASSAVAVGGHEHGKRGGLHDYRTGHEDHESRGPENRHGVETVCTVYSVCDAVFLPVRDGCELTCIILKLIWKMIWEPPEGTVLSGGFSLFCVPVRRSEKYCT